MARWLSRSLAIAGVSGTLLAGGAGLAAADPVQGADAKNAQGQLPQLPIPTDLAKQLPVQLPPLKVPQLPPLSLPSGLPALPVPSGPLVCGVALGVGGPINASCPHSGQKVQTVAPKPHSITTTVVRKVVVTESPAPPPAAQAAPVRPVAAPRKLAYTGFETMPIAAAGLAALIGGTVLTAVARPRRRDGSIPA